MDRCECYKWGERFECRYSDGRPYGIMVGYNYCSGTKECDACSCGGDKTQCDFYPDVKRKAIYKMKGIKTNADIIRNMTNEELAEVINKHVDKSCDFCRPYYNEESLGYVSCDENCVSGILRWLKKENER